MITSKAVAAQHKRRRDQLGMPYQTACGNLRKSLIFHMAQKLGEDNCFRCRLKIETEDEMTLDHKIEWENVDPKLFFDVTNVAFSHAKCNRPRINGAIKLRKIGPHDTAWCGTCQDFLSVSKFNKCNSHWNGLNRDCRSCQSLKRNAGNRGPKGSRKVGAPKSKEGC